MSYKDFFFVSGIVCIVSMIVLVSFFIIARCKRLSFKSEDKDISNTAYYLIFIVMVAWGISFVIVNYVSYLYPWQVREGVSVKVSEANYRDKLILERCSINYKDFKGESIYDVYSINLSEEPLNLLEVLQFHYPEWLKCERVRSDGKSIKVKSSDINMVKETNRYWWCIRYGDSFYKINSKEKRRIEKLKEVNDSFTIVYDTTSKVLFYGEVAEYPLYERCHIVFDDN